jgi:hypothetical protein
MTHVLVVVGKVLAVAEFAAAFTLVARVSFPRSAARVRGSALTYAGDMTSRWLTGSWAQVARNSAVAGWHPRSPTGSWRSLRQAAGPAPTQEGLVPRSSCPGESHMLTEPCRSVFMQFGRWIIT